MSFLAHFDSAVGFYPMDERLAFRRRCRPDFAIGFGDAIGEMPVIRPLATGAHGIARVIWMISGFGAFPAAKGT